MPVILCYEKYALCYSFKQKNKGQEVLVDIKIDQNGVAGNWKPIFMDIMDSHGLK